MSSTEEKQRSQNAFFAGIDEHFDVLVTAVLLLGGLAVLGLSIFAGIGQWGIGFALVFGSVGYTFIRVKDTSAPTSASVSKRSYQIATAVFAVAVVLTALSLFLMTPTSGRPWWHFAAVTIATGTVVVDALYSETASRPARVRRLALGKLLVAVLLYRAGRFYVYDTIPGFDIHSHLRLAGFIVTAGAIPGPGDALYGRYATAVVFHTLLAALELFGLGEKNALFAVVSLYAVATVLLAYLLGRELASPPVGVLAALFVGASDMFIVRGVTSITPSILVIIFGMVLLYAATQTERARRYGFLVVGVFAVALFTHHLSSIIILLIFTGLWVGRAASNTNLVPDTRDRIIASTAILAAMVIATLLSWLVTDYDSELSLFSIAVFRLLRLVNQLVAGGSGAYSQSLSQHGFWSNFLYTFGYSALFGIAVVGALLWTHRSNRSPARFAFMIAAAAVFALIYPGTAAGLGHFIIPHRVLAFLVMFLALFAGVAIHHISRRLPAGTFASFMLVTMVVGMSLTAPFVAADNPLYAEERVADTAPSSSEVDAMLFATGVAEDGLVVYIDPILLPNEVRTEQRRTGHAEHDSVRRYPPDDSWSQDSLVVVRDWYIEGGYRQAGPTTFGSEAETANAYGPTPLRGCETQLLYRNSAAAVYRLPHGC